MLPKAAHISTVHRADDTRIYHKQCKTLADAGYDVTLVARPPVLELDDPRIRFRELPHTRNRTGRVALGSIAALKIALQLNCDVYHLHDPELIPLGLFLKLLGRRVVYDVHEDVPAQIRTKGWLPSPLRPPISRGVSIVHWVAGALFDRVVAARADAAKGFPQAKVVLVENYPLMSEYAAMTLRASCHGCDRYRVVYVGNITRLRGIMEMVEAVALVASKHDITLELAGPFNPPSLQDEVERSAGWEYVNYHGWVDRNGMMELFKGSIAGLMMFHPAPNHMRSYPNKLFEYMSAGLPIIASDIPNWKQFITDLGTGMQISPSDPEAIADAIVHLIENPEVAKAMGDRGREAVEGKFTWERAGEALLAMYDELIGSSVTK